MTEALDRLAPECRQVLDRHVRAETAFDMAGTLATLTEDCRFEDVPEGRLYLGREGARSYYERWWGAFRVRPEGGRLYVPDPHTLIVETRFVGSHQGDWDGSAATGRALDLPLVIVVAFAGGLMSGERFYYDRATLRQQIGAA